MKPIKLLPMLALATALVFAAGAAFAQTDSAATPFLGVGIGEDPAGALINRVLPGSPAALAGLEVGDIVTAVDGETATADNLVDLIGSKSVGSVVELDVLRGGETLSLTATLGARETFDADIRPFRGAMMQRAFLGVTLADTDAGVTIQDVVANSPAADAGLVIGDVIEEANGEPIESARGLVDLIGGLNAGDTLSLTYTRDGDTLTADIELAAGGPRMMRSFGFDRATMIVYNAIDGIWQVVALDQSSPLYEAGLRPGDAIAAIDGETYNPAALQAYLDGLDAGASVTLTVERGDETLEITTPVEALEALSRPMMQLFGEGRTPFRFRLPEDARGMFAPFAGVRLGVSYLSLDEPVAAERGLEVTEGALITEVVADSPAAAAGLQVDDVVTAVNSDVVDAERTLRDRLLAYEPEDTVTLTVLRGGETLDIDVTLGAPEGLPFFHNFGRFGGNLPDFFGPDRGRGFQFNIPLPALPELVAPADGLLA